MRFLGSRPSMDEASLRHLVEVDYTWRLALVAVSGEGRGIAIGRYEGAPGERSAEVAVAVEPGWRRVGLGTGLLVLLAFAAAARGIRAFLATYSGENYEVSRMVARSGLPHRTTVSRGVTEAEIDLTELAVDDPFGTLRNLLGRGTAG
jgi:GNAT superfamily N-acetyltransferase